MLNTRRSRSSTVLHWIVAFVVVVTVAITAQQQGHRRLYQIPTPQAQPLPDRTTPRLNAMTPAQRYHSTLFPHYRFHTRLLDSKESVTVTTEPTGGPLKPLREFLNENTCSADASFEGVVLSGESFPVDDGSFLFTDYRVRVTQLRRQPRGRNLQIAEIVTVAAPGGDVIVEGEHIRATSTGDPLLDIGLTYLFFVNHHSSYRVFDVAGPRFRIENGRVTLAITDLPTGILAFPQDGISWTQFEQVSSAPPPCR